MMKNICKIIESLVVWLVPCALIGQAQIDTGFQQILSEVSIVGEATKNGTICYVDSIASAAIFQSSAKSMMDRQLGVLGFNGENFAQDLRISIRGFGARSAFGIRGIRMYMDDIPLSSPDGTTQIDELSNYDIASISVIKSRGSSIMGNAGGGAILLYSPVLTKTQWQLHTRVNTIGSYDIGIKKQTFWKNVKGYYSVQHQRFNGQRDHTKAQNTSFYTKHHIAWHHSIYSKLIINSYYSPLGQDPGGINMEQVTDNRWQANGRNLQFNAGEAVRGNMIGIHTVYGINHKLSITSIGYLKVRKFEGRLANEDRGYITFDRLLGGIAHKIIYTPNSVFKITVGHTNDIQKDDREVFKNVEGTKGDLQVDQIESVRSNGLFAGLHIEIDRWKLGTNTRFDHINYSLQKEDNRNDRSFNAWNQSLDLSYRVFKNSYLFTNFSTAFETPTLNELTNNPYDSLALLDRLLPERSRQWEIGMRNSFKKGKYTWQINYFNIKVDDQIIPYELSQFVGKTFFGNLANTRRKGLEAQLIRFHKYGSLSMSYTYSDFRYVDYFSSLGKADARQSLIPVHRWLMNADINLGRYVECNVLGVYNSKIWLDDRNVNVAPSSFDLSLDLHTSDRFSSRYKFGIQGANLANTYDYANLRSNVANGRSFEPASARHFGIYLRANL